MPSPRVSILLPVYNAAGTLEETLESISAQTFTDFEVVAVDDGSEDDSRAVLEKWRSREARLRCYTGPRRGLIDTLSDGLSRCSGEYVARMDADDRMSADRLAAQVALMDGSPDVSVVGCLVEIFADGPVGEGMRIYEAWLNGLVSHDDIIREMFIESPIAHPSAMVRRAEIVALGGYQERGWPEDYDLWLRYHAAGKRFIKAPEVLLYWREHETRATRTDSRYSVENFIRAKAHYLSAGPLAARDTLIIWGAGQTGRRLSKHLIRAGHTPAVFIDINPEKIGRTLRQIPIVGPEALPTFWRSHQRPILLVAVASRGARTLIREELRRLNLVEGNDFLCVA